VRNHGDGFYVFVLSVIHDSSLADHAPDWIIFNEIVDTGRMYGSHSHRMQHEFRTMSCLGSVCTLFNLNFCRMVRDVCAIQGAWLPMLAPHFFHSRVHADASKRARS
jgi:hypothetical protein